MQTEVENAKAKGYTQQYCASAGALDLCILVKPGTDLDGRFKAYDVDADQWIWVNGWTLAIEEAEEDAQ